MVYRARMAMPGVFGGQRCKSAKCSEWMKWARGKASGCMITRLPKAGDIVNYLPNRSHLGIVERYDAMKRVVHTIEGNTDDGGSGEGDGIYRMQRKLSFCGEFYRVPVLPAAGNP